MCSNSEMIPGSEYWPPAGCGLRYCALTCNFKASRLAAAVWRGSGPLGALLSTQGTIRSFPSPGADRGCLTPRQLALAVKTATLSSRPQPGSGCHHSSDSRFMMSAGQQRKFDMRYFTSLNHEVIFIKSRYTGGMHCYC